jgi:5-methylcytosine-specific restriction protein A
MSVSQAIEFVCRGFFDPTIDHPECVGKVRDIAKNYRGWVRTFTHTGDLFDFLQFLNASSDTTVFANQSKLGLKTITEAVSDFETRFQNELADRLYLDDLIIGETYPTQMIHAICGSYDMRSGGILPVFRENGTAEFVAIKATLSGGNYPNEWLDKGKRLKYFMKARGGNFKETYIENAAIIENPQSPVHAFVRDTKMDKFTYWGRFFRFAIHTEIDGSKWFELAEWSNGLSQLRSVAAVDLSLAEDVRRSLTDDRTKRLRRLADAPSRPKKKMATTTVFDRNPDVIAEVLFRANGICEACDDAAPFERNTDKTPYLEVHHKTPLSKDGPDTVENAVALCPNCHRSEHSGPAKWPH